MRKYLWSILLIMTVVVGATVLFSTGRQAGQSTSGRTPNEPPPSPLPPATAVAGSTDPVSSIPARPTRIRVELDSTAPTALITFSVSRSGDGGTPTELKDHPLPWAAELDAPGGTSGADDDLSVDGYVANRGRVDQVRCRILVGGIVVEAKQGAGYAGCRFHTRDLRG